MGAAARGGGDPTQSIFQKTDVVANGPLPNINIALPPPPPSHPPVTLPCLDRLLTPSTAAFDRHLISADSLSATSPLLLDSAPDWINANTDYKATDLLSAPILDPTTDSAITDHLLLLLQTHNSKHDHHSLPPPPPPPTTISDSAALDPSSFFATKALRFDTRDAVKSPLDAPAEGVIKSAAWLDRLMSGSTQDVFSDVSPFRPNDPGFLQPAEVFSDLACGVHSEQPPSPLQKFHSWQQGHSLNYPPPPETSQRLLSDQTRFSPPHPFSQTGAEGESGLHDILGMLAGQKVGRERASSLPHADIPNLPSPQIAGNALQVPDAPNRLWGSAENLNFGSEGPPSPNAEFHRRLQQAASMELQRNGEADVATTGRTPTSPPPPPPRSRRAPAKGWWKTEVCKFWKEGTGCRNGANCRWAHGDQELRRMDDPSPRGEGEVTTGFNLSPSGFSRPTWSHERLLLDPLPRPSISPSMNIRGTDEQSCSVLSGTGSENVNKWTILPIHYMLQVKRARALEEVWQLIRMKNLPYLSLVENILIASAPGIRADLEYWEDLLDTLAGIDPEDRTRSTSYPLVGGLRRCLFCGSLDPNVRDASSLLNTADVSEQCPPGIPTPLICDRCAQIAENKAHCANLFPAELSSYDSEDRSTSWGFKIAQFMRSCEDGSWYLQSEHGSSLRKGQTVDLWVQHQRYIARVWFVFHASFRAMEGHKRLHLHSLQFLESLSFAEWTAVAHQPILFAVLLLSSFPVSRSSVPSSLTSVAIPLDSWKHSLFENRSPLGPAPPRPRFLAPPSRASDQPPLGISSGKGTSLGTPSKRSTSPTGTATPVDADLACVAAAADEILLGDDFSCYKALVE